MPLEDIYVSEYEVLKKLFGDSFIGARIGRLNEIYNFTENIWHTYIEMIPNRLVKYLLIAEAPPWRESGAQPQYFLDPNSDSRTLMRAFKNAFIQDPNIHDPEIVISLFAESGLLLIDSIPFSLIYTGKRNSRHYNRLIELSVHSYMINKLSTNELIFSNNLKISFGYEANAITIMNALGNTLNIAGQIYPINNNMICTNRAHYPDTNMIRSIYGLNVV